MENKNLIFNVITMQKCSSPNRLTWAFQYFEISLEGPSKDNFVSVLTRTNKNEYMNLLSQIPFID